MDALATLHALLPSRVGSPLSVNGLASVLRVSHKTVGTWLAAFENLNLCFRISPWHASLTRAVVKEQKLYLLDYTQVSEEGPLLENLAAVELQRATTFWTDIGLGSYSLHYARLKSKEEADFLVCERRRPLCLFEVKLSDDTPSPGLLKIQRLMNVPSVLLVKNIEYFKVLRRNGRMRTLVAPMAHYFARLP